MKFPVPAYARVTSTNPFRSDRIKTIESEETESAKNCTSELTAPRLRPTRPSASYGSELQNSMQQFPSLVVLTLLVLQQSLCSPTLSRCVEDEPISPLCMANLEEYYAQVINLPSRLNERSLAAWAYVENVDLDRVPQVIHEAVCLTRHSCNGVDGAFGVESIPIAIKMPVLRRNPGCQFQSIEFESVNIACICAAARRS